MMTTKRGILFFKRLIDFVVRKLTCGGLGFFELKKNDLRLSVSVPRVFLMKVDHLSTGGSGRTANLLT
jgi:hypothetical protein